VIGLLTADSLKGILGIPEPLTHEMVDAMAAGALVRDEHFNSSAGWDSDGFRAGVEDILAVEWTADAVRAFLRSDELRVTKDELATIIVELGAPAQILMAPLVNEWLMEDAAQNEGSES
jgi:hypothetical protein